MNGKIKIFAIKRRPSPPYTVMTTGAPEVLQMAPPFTWVTSMRTRGIKTCML